MVQLDYSPEENAYKGVSMHAGFPNAADDSRLRALDLNTLLIERPNSTFHFRVAGKHWEGIGIFDGDIALVDRALDALSNDLVVWWHNDTFAISPYNRLPRNAMVWGVVISTIHQWKGVHYAPAT
jgi:hypothetical protein